MIRCHRPAPFGRCIQVGGVEDEYQAIARIDNGIEHGELGPYVRAWHKYRASEGTNYEGMDAGRRKEVYTWHDDEQLMVGIVDDD
jgi:hypothetical protein